MPPTFRSDLVCSREEQQGVVFYRIDDPKTQTSFRLYEIEYLIATKLDGKHEPQQIIETVKSEFNFDITVPDLERFVGQLESMGFLAGGAPAKPPAAAAGEEVDTNVMARPKPPEELDIVEPDMIVEDAASEPDKRNEFERLLKSALLHVKQGYIVHARDYFLAAKEIRPNDERLLALIRHLEIIGDASGPAEVTYLWNQAKELFPEEALAVGPMAEGKAPRATGTVPGVAGGEGKEDSLRSRLLWTLLLVAVLVVGVGALYYVIKVGRIFDAAAKVNVAPVHASRVSVYFPKEAIEVKPLGEVWLSFEADGKLVTELPIVGTRVDAGAVLLQLELQDGQQKQLEKARAAVEKAQGEYDSAAKALESLMAEREGIETERAAAEKSLRDMGPKAVLGQGGVSKRDIEELKHAKVQANKKLTNMAKKEKKPRAAAAKAEKALAAAKKHLEGLEKKLAPRLIRAPSAGTIAELKIAAGETAQKAKPVILLRDASGVRLAFLVPAKADFQVGGEALVSVGHGKPSHAKVAAVTPAGTDKRVEISLADATGSYATMAVKEFHLVKEFVEPAFLVPTSAVIQGKQGPHLLLDLQNRALERPVDVIENDEANTTVRDNSGALREGVLVVVSKDGGGDISSIPDGSMLETSGPAPAP